MAEGRNLKTNLKSIEFSDGGFHFNLEDQVV